MGRYNEILRRIEEMRPDQIFWIDRDGKLLAEDWAHGFMRAVGWRAKSWGKLLFSKRDRKLLFPIASLCRDRKGQSLMGLDTEDDGRVTERSTELLPASIVAIHAYWRVDGPDLPHVNPAREVGRNHRCPCGSGKKFKKCCGRND